VFLDIVRASDNPAQAWISYGSVRPASAKVNFDLTSLHGDAAQGDPR
jgi:hypothetical protein